MRIKMHSASIKQAMLHDAIKLIHAKAPVFAMSSLCFCQGAGFVFLASKDLTKNLPRLLPVDLNQPPKYIFL